jgi:hypothetical protein
MPLYTVCGRSIKEFNNVMNLKKARKDARPIMEEVNTGGEELSTIPLITKAMDVWIAKRFQRV